MASVSCVVVYRITGQGIEEIWREAKGNRTAERTSDCLAKSRAFDGELVGGEVAKQTPLTLRKTPAYIRTLIHRATADLRGGRERSWGIFGC